MDTVHVSKTTALKFMKTFFPSLENVRKGDRKVTRSDSLKIGAVINVDGAFNPGIICKQSIVLFLSIGFWWKWSLIIDNTE